MKVSCKDCANYVEENGECRPHDPRYDEVYNLEWEDIESYSECEMYKEIKGE